ncbi:Cilia- and flagella-associated protein 43 [Durusdinium trenchii]|uniref:Cilia- and flagella-associated protein 43 n=1 Tax=Durusdinium trenchii TaxID=1381693 RepID=A0ABP0HH80_9DINO
MAQARMIRGGQNSGFCSALVFLDQEAVLEIAGNALLKTVLKSGEQTVIQTDAKRGISCLASCPSKALFAYSCRAREPTIVVRGPQQVKAELKGGSPLEYALLDISYDGTRLVSVGALLDKEMIVWDLRSMNQIASVALRQEVSKVSFSPVNPANLSTFGPQGVRLWNLRETPKAAELVEVVQDSSSPEGPRAAASGNDAQPMTITDAVWSREGDLVVFDQERITRFHPNSKAVVKVLDNKYGALVAQTIRGMFVLGCADGTVCWVSESTFILQDKKVLDGSVRHLRLSLHCDRCLVETSTGNQFVLHGLPNQDGKIENQHLADVHFEAVSAVTPVYSCKQNPSLVASVSKDCSLRVWDLARSSKVPVASDLVSTTNSKTGEETPEVVVSITSSPKTPFLALGTEAGRLKIVQVVSARGDLSISVVQTLQIQDGPVSQLEFNDEGTLLATGACSGDETVNIFAVQTPKNAKQSVAALAGVITLDASHELLALAWQTSQSLILTARNTGNDAEKAKVFRVTVPGPKQHLTAGPARLVQELVTTLDGVRGGCIGRIAALGSGRLVGSVTHTPQNLDVFEGESIAASTPLHCAAHESSIWTVAVQGEAFATGGVDGAITIWNDGSDIKAIQKSAAWSSQAHTMVTSLCFSADGRFVVAGHVDGSLSIVEVADTMVQEAAGFSLARPIAVDLISSGNTLQIAGEGKGRTEAARWKQRAQDVLDEEYEKKRSERRGQIKILQSRLHALLEKNKSVPPLEKLDRHEFVVDVKGKQEFCERNEAAATTLRNKIEREIKGRELVYSKIVAECSESMETPSREIHALETKHFVRNYAIPKQSEVEKRRVNNVIQNRTVELMELRVESGAKGAKVWPSNKTMQVVPQDTNWIVNAGSIIPCYDAAGMEQLHLGGQENATTKEDGAETGAEDQGKEDDVAEGGNEAANDGGEGDDAGGDAGAEAKDGEEEARSGDKLALHELLYHPATLRSQVQIRSQIVLLKQLQREMMTSFNMRFEKVTEEKEDAVERIASKYERINEILRELKQPCEEMPNFWHPSENPRSALEVSQDEIGVEKYLSKSERQRLALEEEERLRKEAEAAKDNMGERALQDMMRGTLEAVKELTLAEQTMERPEWMLEIDYAEMDEEQRKEADDFEARFQKFSEEQEKYIKLLEQELKKIHGEVQEIVAGFDAAIELLYKLKVRVAESVALQRLFTARLSLSILQQEDLVVNLKRCNEQIAVEAQNIVKLNAELDEYIDTLEAQKARLATATEADKAIEKSFKVQLQDQAADLGCSDLLDADALRVFQALFKLRAGEHLGKSFDDQSVSHSRRGSFSKDRMMRRNSRGSDAGSLGRRGSSSRDIAAAAEAAESEAAAAAAAANAHEANLAGFDPFVQMDKRLTPEEELANKRKAALKPLSNLDCPEGFAIEPEQWELLQRVRLEKIESELQVESVSLVCDEMQGYYDQLAARRDRVEHTLQLLNEEKRTIEHAQKTNAQNVEVIVRCKQGQDEVKVKGVITDYTNSLLLSRRVIERENKEIMTLGDAKIGVMTKMKDFRKSINFMQWEHKFMLQQEFDLEEHYTDLHMLRVTRGLQEMIKGGEMEDKLEQSQQIESKAAKMKAIHNSKMAKIQASLDRIVDKEAVLRAENDALVAQIDELSSNVEMRDAVLQARGGKSVLEEKASGAKRKSRHAAGSGATAAKARMKAVVTRRKLMDLARAQTDEIEFLKQELDGLREKNFPRFSAPSSSLAERGMPYQRHPDEREQ